MSWFSAAFTRSKSAIEAAVSLVPVVGAPLAHAVGSIHTGDEHQDASGQWVNNSTGAPVMVPPSPGLQAEIDRVNAVNAQLVSDARQAAADSAARIGGGLSLQAAAAIGPEGNKYQSLLTAAKSPLGIAGIGAVVLLLLYLFMRD